MSRADWIQFKKDYKDKSYFNERIYSLLYFGLIHKCVHKFHPQNLVVDKENYLDINRVLRYLQYLAKSNDYQLITSFSYSDSNFLIKLADLVAAACRKVDRNSLLRYDRYKIFKLKDIHFKFISRIFEK